jgi:membrane-associated phospholipid phosphatase
MKIKRMFSIILLLTISLTSFAQEKVSKEEIHINVNEVLTENQTLVELEDNRKLILDESESDLDIIKSIPKDAWALIKAPIGWTKKEWIIASGAVTMTTLLMTGDKRVRDFFQRNKSHFSEQVSYYAEMGGTGAPVGLAATYLIGTILKNPKLKKASTLAFSSLLISGVLVQGLKQVFSRTRPYAALDQWEFQGPGKIKGKDHVSFPSGHTAAAFSVAASIATIYDSKLIKVLAYSAATLTGLSRIHDNKHWMSDVFMGAILGTVTGIFVTKRHMMMKPNSRIQLAPAIINVNNQTGYGLGITIKLDKKKKKRKPLF